MSEKSSFLNDKLLPAISRFSNFKFVRAMTNGIVAPTAATIVGSIIAILQTPPFPATSTSTFVTAWRAWSAANAGWLSLTYTVTLNAVALYTLVGVVVATCDIERRRPVTPLITSLMSFLILCCNYDAETASLSTGFFGSAGLFTAILVGFLIPELVFFFEDKGFKIKMPDSVPPNIADSIGSMIYVILIAALMVIIRLLTGLSGMLLPGLINKIFSPLFSASDTIWAVLLYCLFTRFLWFFGLHGNNIAGSVMGAFLTHNMTANIEAYAAGQPLPYIFTGSFQGIWTTMGMLPIAVTILLFCRSKQLKAVGRISVVPALFSIGEPLTFGVPLVMNFDIFIPYLLNFAINGCAAYIATQVGFLKRTFVSVPWTLPHIVKAFLSAMDWHAVILYIILFVINVIIMLPFVKRYDRRLLSEENAGMRNE